MKCIWRQMVFYFEQFEMAFLCHTFTQTKKKTRVQNQFVEKINESELNPLEHAMFPLEFK